VGTFWRWLDTCLSSGVELLRNSSNTGEPTGMCSTSDDDQNSIPELSTQFSIFLRDSIQQKMWKLIH